jgi:hypothetical protein
MSDISSLGAIAMPAAHLQELLRRVADGEDPDMVFVEELANAEQGSIREWAEQRERTDS